MLLAAVLAACVEALDESGDSQARESAEPEENRCGCYDGDCRGVTESWSTDGICVAIDGRLGDFYLFGMAETGSGEGWYGEDCLDGPGPNSGDYDICHPLPACTTTCLETVRDPAEVVAGQTTLFTDTIAGNITYLLATETDCWTWGHDTSYYTSSLGCAVN